MLEKTTSHKLLIAAGTLLAGFSLATIVFVTSPETASTIVFVSLYASAFLFCTGLVTFIGLSFRQKLSHGLYVTSLGISLRQGLLLATLTTTSLFLSSQGLLYWWVGAMLLLFFIFLEIFFNLS